VRESPPFAIDERAVLFFVYMLICTGEAEEEEDWAAVTSKLWSLQRAFFVGWHESGSFMYASRSDSIPVRACLLVIPRERIGRNVVRNLSSKGFLLLPPLFPWLVRERLWGQSLGGEEVKDPPGWLTVVKPSESMIELIVIAVSFAFVLMDKKCAGVPCQISWLLLSPWCRLICKDTRGRNKFHQHVPPG
jgi:hypothetical protein